MKKIQVTNATYEKIIELRSLLYTKRMTKDILDRETVIEFAVTTLIDGLTNHLKPVEAEPTYLFNEDELVTTNEFFDSDGTELLTPEEYFKTRPEELEEIKKSIKK